MSKFLASDVCRPFLVSKGGQCRAKSKFGYYLFFDRGGYHGFVGLQLFSPSGSRNMPLIYLEMLDSIGFW